MPNGMQPAQQDTTLSELERATAQAGSDVPAGMLAQALAGARATADQRLQAALAAQRLKQEAWERWFGLRRKEERSAEKEEEEQRKYAAIAQALSAGASMTARAPAGQPQTAAQMTGAGRYPTTTSYMGQMYRPYGATSGGTMPSIYDWRP